MRQQPPGWFRFSRLEQINRNVTTRRILHFSRTRARGTHSLLCWSTPRRSTSTHCSCPGSAAAAAGDGQGHHRHGGARRRRRRHHHLQPARQRPLFRRYGVLRIPIIHFTQERPRPVRPHPPPPFGVSWLGDCAGVNSDSILRFARQQ